MRTKHKDLLDLEQEHSSGLDLCKDELQMIGLEVHLDQIQMAQTDFESKMNLRQATMVRMNVLHQMLDPCQHLETFLKKFATFNLIFYLKMGIFP